MTAYNYHLSYFFISVPTIYDLPNDTLSIEVAFVGYSNSGKSSVINALTNSKKLTKVSCIPGSTKQINLFEIKSGIRLIDFPGYGYSQNIKIRNNYWYKVVCQYLTKRTNLRGLVLIMDIRHVIKNLDRGIINYALKLDIHILILLNKSDKFSKNGQKIMLQLVQQEVNKTFLKSSQYIQIKIFSSVKKYGIESLKRILDFWLSDGRLNLDI